MKTLLTTIITTALISLNVNAQDIWSDIEKDENGVFNTGWMGWLQDEGHAPWYYHFEHGWLYFAEGTEDNISYYDTWAQTWFWTTKDLFPYVYKFAENEGWYKYNRWGTPGTRLFVDTNSNDVLKETELNNAERPYTESFKAVYAGNFTMGDTFSYGSPDEAPTHTVTVSTFGIGQTEVTNRQVAEVYQWAYENDQLTVSSNIVLNHTGDAQELLDLDDEDCMIYWNGSNFLVDEENLNKPCVEITWYGAVAYCVYKSQMENLQPAYDLSDWSIDYNVSSYRLPTEAEWEYAAKGGTLSNVNETGFYYLYSGSNTADEVSWCWETMISDTTLLLEPNEVALKSPNELGIFDMSGNVWEWCNDWFSNYTDTEQYNPTGSETGFYKVIRGGYWGYYATRTRTTNRGKVKQDQSDHIGFRLVRSFHILI